MCSLIEFSDLGHYYIDSTKLAIIFRAQFSTKNNTIELVEAGLLFKY